ncbi:MAG: single-stranded-DNA-specific exonuclease RecJ [Gemmatimonadota bacterium]
MSALPPPLHPRWIIGAPPPASEVAHLQEALNLPAALCALLVLRGFADVDAAKRFLRPVLDDLHPPELLAGAEAAADRIARAVRDGETMLVHGDYDVDGVAAAALLTRWLRRLGGIVVPFVPHRTRHGYDFGEAGLAVARDGGATLVITADSGIVAHATVERAGGHGIDVVVTDHHTPSATLPAAVAVVNPLRPDCGYPDKGLCGTGVAFKLCQLLGARFDVPEEELLPHLDLVALATIADLVPLEGENRALVRYGLRALRATTKPGLTALLRITGLEGASVEAGQIGFVLAPRINAAGRIGDADAALRLLLTEDPGEAEELARRLDHENGERRTESDRIFDEALALLARDFDPERDFGVVVASEGWHPGVVGIVASKVVERLHRPAILVALDGESGRGSARSIRGFDLFEAVRACEAHLTRFGGHSQAAGMDLRSADLDAFRRAFNAEAARRLAGTPLLPSFSAEYEIGLSEITPEFFHWLGYLGPFGMQNPRPVFWARELRLVGPARTVGQGHLKLRLGQGSAQLEAIGFRLCERVPPQELDGSPVDVAFKLARNTYRGRESIQAHIVDVRPSGAPPPYAANAAGPAGAEQTGCGTNVTRPASSSSSAAGRA